MLFNAFRSNFQIPRVDKNVTVDSRSGLDICIRRGLFE